MAHEAFLPPSFHRLTDGKTLLPGLSNLDASKLKVTLTSNPKLVPAADAAELNSHKVFTDHMILARWNAKSGWAAPQMVPHGPLSLPPSASVLHYATACFEGMKAYRGYDGKLRLFRPSHNCARMLASSIRISLPGFEPDQLLELVRKLCEMDAPKWLPRDQTASSLYIRPTLVGVDDSLGFQAPQEALMFIIMSYWPSLNPPAEGLRLLTSDKDTVRAWPGGSGSAKVAANYGPSILAHSQAKKMGCDQVLWLFGDDGQVTEAGSTNFFVIWENAEGNLEMVTPPLNEHTILPGVTRQSVLDLGRERLSVHSTDVQRMGLKPVETVERKFTIHDILTASKEGRLVSSFAVGTAASIVPVGRIRFEDQEIVVPFAEAPYVSMFKKWLDDIRLGNEAHPWAEVIDEGVSS